MTRRGNACNCLFVRVLGNIKIILGIWHTIYWRLNRTGPDRHCLRTNCTRPIFLKVDGSKKVPVSLKSWTVQSIIVAQTTPPATVLPNLPITTVYETDTKILNRFFGHCCCCCYNNNNNKNNIVLSNGYAFRWNFLTRREKNKRLFSRRFHVHDSCNIPLTVVIVLWGQNNIWWKFLGCSFRKVSAENWICKFQNLAFKYKGRSL